MRAVKFPIQSEWAQYAHFALVTGLGIVAAWAIASTGLQFRALPVKHYNSYGCDVSRSAGTEPSDDATFRILDVFRLDTNELADRLCDSASIGKRYARVEVTWIHRDQLDLREIINRTYQLVLAKPELLRGLTETHISDYIPLASYRNYAGELLSIKYAPRLSNDFLAGKRLGLIDDPNSLSGYQIPKAAFRRANIDESAFTTVFFKSHADLHRALLAGDVDVIGSYFATYFDDARAAIKRIDLQRGLSGMQWYLHPALVDTSIHCELLRELVRYPGAVGAPSSIDTPPATGCADAL